MSRPDHLAERVGPGVDRFALKNLNVSHSSIGCASLVDRRCLDLGLAGHGEKRYCARDKRQTCKRAKTC